LLLKGESVETLVDRFLQERQYLLNVSPKTLELYKYSFQAFAGAVGSIDAIKARVVELRTKGLAPVSVNTYLRHLKALYLWRGHPWPLKPLKEEKNLIHTLTAQQVERLVPAKFKRRDLVRAHLVAITILDTGLRATEALKLRREHVDLDNLVLHIVGKGNKHRLVPFSHALRKLIWRALSDLSPAGGYIFGTRNNTTVSVRNLERDFKLVGAKLKITGVRFSPHTLRHTFACSYLRNGGDLFTLSRILGHSSISTTQLYLRSIGIEHVAEAHQKFSPLSARR
jgi:integrase/recombinase XerD